MALERKDGSDITSRFVGMCPILYILGMMMPLEVFMCSYGSVHVGVGDVTCRFRGSYGPIDTRDDVTWRF